jgi:hypothetical protein
MKAGSRCKKRADSLNDATAHLKDVSYNLSVAQETSDHDVMLALKKSENGLGWHRTDEPDEINAEPWRKRIVVYEDPSDGKRYDLHDATYVRDTKTRRTFTFTERWYLRDTRTGKYWTSPSAWCEYAAKKNPTVPNKGKINGWLKLIAVFVDEHTNAKKVIWVYGRFYIPSDNGRGATQESFSNVANDDDDTRGEEEVEQRQRERSPSPPPPPLPPKNRTVTSAKPVEPPERSLCGGKRNFSQSSSSTEESNEQPAKEEDEMTENAPPPTKKMIVAAELQLMKQLDLHAVLRNPKTTVETFREMVPTSKLITSMQTMENACPEYETLQTDAEKAEYWSRHHVIVRPDYIKMRSKYAMEILECKFLPKGQKHKLARYDLRSRRVTKQDQVERLLVSLHMSKTFSNSLLYQIDHIGPLGMSMPDCPCNLQILTVAMHNAKTRAFDQPEMNRLDAH